MMYETQMQPDGTFWCIVVILLVCGAFAVLNVIHPPTDDE